MSAAQPGGRTPAPPHLTPVQDLLNSADLEAGTDDLDAIHFPAWLARWQGISAEAGMDDDRLDLLRFREALRGWIASRTPAIPPEVAGPIHQARIVVEVRDGGVAWGGDSVFAQVIAPVVRGIDTALRDGTWQRLKVCERDICRWVFYDHSKNTASHWCATSICGAREKSRRAYARRRSRESNT